MRTKWPAENDEAPPMGKIGGAREKWKAQARGLRAGGYFIRSICRARLMEVFKRRW